MAPKGKKRQSTTYDSDNGFVANDSGDNEVSHRAKKARTTKSTISSAKPKPKSSSSKNAATSASAKPEGAGKVDSNGDQYWELSRLRRVTVSSFKGRTLVNVREYYEKDGQELPGKKGISMPIDQFSGMVKLLPNIEAALKEKGESLPRPEYGVSGEQGGEEEEEDEDEEGEEEGDDAQDDVDQWENASEEEEEEVKPRSKNDKQGKRKKNGVRKKNIEATSDEDE